MCIFFEIRAKGDGKTLYENCAVAEEGEKSLLPLTLGDRSVAVLCLRVFLVCVLLLPRAPASSLARGRCSTSAG